MIAAVQLTSQLKDGIDFITISGRTVYDASVFRLREHVQFQIEAGVRRFVIDVSEVPYVDSCGCGEVVSAHTSIVRAGGALAFVNPAERVRTLWEWMKLSQVLHIFNTIDEARLFVLQMKNL